MKIQLPEGTTPAKFKAQGYGVNVPIVQNFLDNENTWEVFGEAAALHGFVERAAQGWRESR